MEYRKSDIIQQINEDKPSFIFTALRDTQVFIWKLFGKYYKKKNNFSFKQKQTILNYLFYKNLIDLSKTKVKSYENVELNSMKYYENQINKLEEIKQHNRMFLISNSLSCYKRIGYLGFIFKKNF